MQRCVKQEITAFVSNFDTRRAVVAFDGVARHAVVFQGFAKARFAFDNFTQILHFSVGHYRPYLGHADPQFFAFDQSHLLSGASH